MAASKPLSQVQTDAQALFAKINASGVSVADRPAIVASAQSLLALLNDLQPHLNDAHTAFGNQTDNIAKVASLRNTLNKIVATYSN